MIVKLPLLSPPLLQSYSHWALRCRQCCVSYHHSCCDDIDAGMLLISLLMCYCRLCHNFMAPPPLRLLACSCWYHWCATAASAAILLYRHHHWCCWQSTARCCRCWCCYQVLPHALPLLLSSTTTDNAAVAIKNYHRNWCKKICDATNIIVEGVCGICVLVMWFMIACLLSELSVCFESCCGWEIVEYSM